MRQKRATTQYHFPCQCSACTQQWPVYNEMVNKPRRWKISMTEELMEEVERQNQCYQVGMEHLIRLDIQKALPLFKDYLVIMNELIEHPDPRYIDCEEAYKQCLWLENRGYKPKPLPASATAPNSTGLGFGASNPPRLWFIVSYYETQTYASQCTSYRNSLNTQHSGVWVELSCTSLISLLIGGFVI